MFSPEWDEKAQNTLSRVEVWGGELYLSFWALGS